ncbi:fungal-specific transcription factor domain-containing protein [Boeremia exigua]|uniref:fungal-specific transcription factor domain-containing protein n=1 Tax=Boeremia exigua TaxID=749465 RepID=UPI001E8E2225|nr:fungal-specific transcription factor domain-containing protein [Boeremia exigua]KAH6638802.1 fungal-specific transcription factor domain-containing protein [Boeremia exigua]
MATTHKRTRTGCWTCREAGYKCDEQKPFCQRCTRLKINCKGYGIRLKWQEQPPEMVVKKPRAKRKKKKSDDSISTPASIASDTSASSTYTASPDTMETTMSVISVPRTPAHGTGLSPDTSAGDRRLLHYWAERLSSLISIAPRGGKPTPFQLHLTSMAYDSAALRSTVLSMAANHLALQTSEPALRFQAYRHQRDAIHLLQALIQDPQQAHSEPALATVLMMQVSARLFGEDDEANVVNHLMGAKAMISRRGTDSWLNSSSARFLLSLFAYHDILSSISRGQKPLFNHDAEFQAVEGADDMQSIAAVLLIVARTSQLQYAIKIRREKGGDYALTEDEDSTGRTLQQKLLAMRFDAQHSDLDSNPDIRFTAEAYRHAAFIYLYRTWLGVGAPNPISVEHIQSCLVYISRVDVTSPLTSAHVWPLWSAGCESIGREQRQFVRDRFRSMYVSKLFPSWNRVMRDMEDVWTAKDEEERMEGQYGMEKVDCIQVILKRGGREVDLA